MTIDATTLPPAHEIDHEEICAAAEKYAAAKEHLEKRQKELGRLDTDRERELARVRDAQAADEALAAGKTPPKRHRVIDHAKKVEDLAHEVRVAQLAVERTLRELQAVVNEHEAEWVASLTAEAAELEREWQEGVAALTALYGQRTVLDRRRRTVTGVGSKPVHNIQVRPQDCIDSLNGDRIQLAAFGFDSQADRVRRRIAIDTHLVLDALRSLGEPQEEPVVGPSVVAERFKLAADHANTVLRGYSFEETIEPTQFVEIGGRKVAVSVPAGGES